MFCKKVGVHYEKVYSINFKKHTILSACNNVRPLIYEKWEMKCENDKDFFIKLMKHCLDGNLHIMNRKSKWYEIVERIRTYVSYRKWYKMYDLESDLHYEYNVITNEERNKNYYIFEDLRTRLLEQYYIYVFEKRVDKIELEKVENEINCLLKQFKEKTINAIEKQIQLLVNQYERLQKQNNGDSYSSRKIEEEIDRLECRIEKLKAGA